MLKPDPPNLTDKFLAVVSLSGGVYYIWWAIPSTFWASVSTLLLFWEAWSLVNQHPNDTISETIWRISDRYPLVSLIGGAALAALIATETITSLWILAPLLVLAGHFWFPRYGKR